MSDIKNMVCGEESNMSKKCVKPQIRFAGFDEEWERRKLGEVAEIVGGGTPSTSIKDYWDGDIDWYTPAEIAEQIYITSSQRKITEEGYNHSSAKMLPVGTVLFTSRAGIGKTVILSRKGCTNQGFQSIVPHKDKLDSYFIFSRGEELKKYGETIGAGSTFIEVSGKQMANMELMLPKIITEQQVIGAYFEKLNKLITLHQRKYDKLVNIKKSMLEKMFLKNGSNVPEIRFTGFTGDWERRKLGEVGSTYTGLSGKSKDDFGHGEGKFITYMNVFSNPIGSSDMLESVEIDDKQNKVLMGDILFTTSSETPEEVGMSCVWLENSENIYLNSFCFGYRLNELFNPYYLAYMLRSSSIRKEITFLAQGISRYNISKNKMMEIKIPIPNIEEQIQIGEYFKQLDKLIVLHQRKVEKLQNIKKACLEKMFI